ncbi:MAG: hypothetical protein JRN06_11855 [Nitrososphaerota archaeon]|nr:hypothetical protein [Nitrososphaerota archaeon]
MNRNLLLFAIFLIVLGAGFNFYPLSLFGLIMLIPALMAPSRPVPRPTGAPTRQEVRRIAPPPRPEPTPVQPKPAAVPQASVMMSPTQQPSPYTSYSPALFPSAIFPSLSPSVAAPPQSTVAAQKPAERDELLETGAVLALVRLIFG